MAKRKPAAAAVTESGDTDMESVQKKWMGVVERHERKRQTWVQRAEKFLKVYADADSAPKQSAKRRYCVTWMNTQTRMPAVYSREPKCVVSRRYQTPSQDVREAVVGLERVTNIQIGDSKLHAAILSARLDRLIPGRGTIWLRYEGKDDGQAITEQKIVAEFVGFKDFGHGEGRVWEEIDCTWRKTYYTKDKLEDRFGEDVMARCGVSLDYAEKDAPDVERQATVYEIWCKSRNACYWLARTAKKALEVGEPPLKLKNFFPHPKPLYGTLTNESCIPTPDPTYYQDQENEINTLTRRIDNLTASLKLVGFYPAGPSNEGRAEIERALQPGFENKMIPVQSWAAFADKGGAGQIVWLPVKDVAFIIEACVKLRQQLLNDVDRISGTSDIMQGETDPNETLGAQQLKAQYGSQRLRDTKDDFVRFAKEACEIIAEVAAENFTAETLGRLAAMQPYQMTEPQVDPQTGQPVPNQPPPQPVIDPNTGLPAEAGWIKLLRNQLAREVLIDVETDSTIHPDEDAEKQRRVELQDVVTKSFAPLLEMQQMNPQMAAVLAPMWGQTTLFTLRGFRAGREIEEVVEETVKKIEAMAQQMAAKPAPPTPEEMKAKEVADKMASDERIRQVEAVEKGKVEITKATQAHTEKMAQFALKNRELDEEGQRHQRELTHQSQLQDRERTFKGEQADKDRSAKAQSEAAKAKPGEDDEDMRIEVKLSPEAEKQMLDQAMAGKAAKTKNEEASAQLMLQLPQLMMQAAQGQLEAAQSLKEAARIMAAPKKLSVVNGEKVAVPVLEGAQ